MIRIMLGNVGSGKTISAVREIERSPYKVFTNIAMNHPNVIRLKYAHIITTKKIGETKSGKDINKLVVNWAFWKKQLKELKYFHIYIDELHNIMPSRRSMSQQNILMSQWVAQIRKITGSSESANFVVMSQELQRIDITIRDLAHEIIFCQKVERFPFTKTKARDGKKIKEVMLPQTFIMHTYFGGEGNVQRYWQWRDMGRKSYDRRSYYYANPFMKYYDSYELVEFGESEYL